MWHDNSYLYRAEYYFKPLLSANSLGGLVVFFKLDPSIYQTITSEYDICFYDYYGNSLPFYCIDSSKYIYLLKLSTVRPTAVYRFFVYYKSSVVNKLPAGSSSSMRVYYFGRRPYSHPTSHSALVNVYDLKLVYDLYDDISSIHITPPYTWDRFCMHVSCWFYVDTSEAGTWQFAIDGDDAVDISIDDTVVASYYSVHGICNCFTHSGSITLSAGWHKLVALHEEYTGGNALFVFFKKPYDTDWRQFSSTVLDTAYYALPDSEILTRDFVEYGYKDLFLGLIYNTIDGLVIFNSFNTQDLKSIAGPDFINSGASTSQEVCSYTGILTSKSINSYVSSDVNLTELTEFYIYCGLFLVSGNTNGTVLSIDDSLYIIVDTDETVFAVVNGTSYPFNFVFPKDVCTSLSIVYKNNTLTFMLGDVVALTLHNVVFNSITKLYLGGGNGHNSVDAYFFTFLLADKSPPENISASYLYHSQYSTLIQESGQDSLNDQCTLIVDPDIIIKDEVGFYKLTYSGTDSTLYVNSDLLCTGLCDTWSPYIVSEDYCNIVYYWGSKVKHLELLVNTVAESSFDVPVYFDSGALQDGLYIIPILLTLQVPTNIGSLDWLTEYTIWDKTTYYVDIPVQFFLYYDSYSYNIDIPVEFYLDINLDRDVFDIPVDLLLSSLYNTYTFDLPTYYTVTAFTDGVTDFPAYFESPKSWYTCHMSNVIVSEEDYQNYRASTATTSGILSRYASDVIVSLQKRTYYKFDTVCSNQVYENYITNSSVISGSINRYPVNVVLSEEYIDNFNTSIKLNTIVFKNFSIAVGEICSNCTCFSVDIIDEFYDINPATIEVYYNDITVSGSITRINYGYTYSWCYDLFTEPPKAVYTFVVKASNLYGDKALQSYYLERGYRFTYNIHHYDVHEYNKLLPILLAAENEVDVFPSESTTNLYVVTENYPYRGLRASINAINTNVGSFTAELTANTTNFYLGGTYKVKIECKDNKGNEMPPFEFEFTINTL